MDPSDTIDQSRELARLTLGFLESHAIPVDPHSFMLGYAYFDGSNPELKTEVDHLIAAGAFNRRSCGRLYEEVFGVDSEARAIRDASSMIEHTLVRVLETIDAAGKEVESYGRTLDDFNGKVRDDAANSGADIRGAIESIMTETRKMKTRSSALEKHFADSTEEIVELRRNLDEMRTAATTDSLTGIANRNHFDIRLREYVDDCARNGDPLSLLMADVDHFKSFNDEHGHQVGDMVLRLVARTISECVRGRDFVARYGGEEFVVLLPKTGLEGAFAVAENIRNTISSKRLALKSTGKTLGMITLSLGVAQFKVGENLAELIGRADAGLYAAKNRGRNRVESTEPLASEVRRVTMRR